MSVNKTLSAITAGVLSIAMCGTLVSMDTFKSSEVEATTTQTAIDIVNDMGMGWNLGNTFDCCNIDWLTPSQPSDIETAWGNPSTTKAMISKIHEYGFETVRIPVTWYQMTDSNYDINDDYLARVKEVVDWCQEEGMYAIINMHWDDSNKNGGGKNWLGTADSDFTNVETKYTTMWNEISTYFADYDNTLVFESNNEPSISVDNLMTLNQDFVDTVRSTGGNNDDRLLLISAPEANLDYACKANFSMPNDPANMQAVSVHYYYPTTFCVADKTSTWGYETTWGTDADINTMVNNFEKLKSTYVDNGIPVILGEYGVLTNDAKDDASIKKFLSSVATYSKAYDGMCGVLWDSGNAGDMQYFDRKELAFFDNEIGNIYTELAGKENIDVPNLDWVETEITTDDEGIVAVQTQGATKVKLEATGLPNSSGTGAIGYWDNNANDGKGQWVQDTIYIRFDVDENGNAVISQTADDPETNTDKDDTNNNYEVTIHDGYFEIPASADTSSIQVMYFYGGYMDGDTWTTMTSDQYPTLTKAYIPGVAGDDTTETTVTTTEQPDDTTTTTTEEEPDQTTTSEPSEEDIFGYVYPIFSNGMAEQWENDGTLGEAVAVTGNGNYTLTINLPEDGAAESILFFALGTDMNSFEQNADEVEIYKDMTFTINDITVDGNPIEYSASDNALGLNDDGATFRMSIYDQWSKRDIQDINPDVVNTSSIVVNFTIDGILGGGDVTGDDTTPIETTVTTVDTTTTDEETSETTTSEGGSTDILLGDVNANGSVKSNDLLLLKKYLLSLADESEINKANSDVNGDGNIKSNDLLMLKKSLLGLIEL